MIIFLHHFHDETITFIVHLTLDTFARMSCTDMYGGCDTVIHPGKCTMEQLLTTISHGNT